MIDYFVVPRWCCWRGESLDFINSPIDRLGVGLGERENYVPIKVLLGETHLSEANGS